MSHLYDIVDALPLNAISTELGVSEKWLHTISQSIILIQLKDSHVPLGTGILIHPSLVLTTRHNLEGLKSSAINVVTGYTSDNVLTIRHLQVDGVVDSNVEYDFAFLKLSAPIEIDETIAPARLQPTAHVPDTALLLHHSKGGPLKCSHGRIVHYSTDSFPIVQALLNADVLSSGGGYFDGNGNCFGIHVSMGRLGLCPTKEILTINTILRCSPKTSILEKVLLNKELELPTVLEDSITLKVTIIGEENPLISRDELLIPIIYTIWIPRIYPNALQKEEAKFFYKILVYGIVEKHIFAKLEESTLVSFGSDGLFRDDQVSCHDKTVNIRGIRIDYMGYNHDKRYRIFQACINLPLKNNLSDSERTGPRKDMTSTVLAQVEMISPAEYYYSSTVNMTKQLTNRLRVALYRSYHSKRITRIT